MRIAYISNGEPEFSTENDVRKAFEYLNNEIVMLQENKLEKQQLENYDYDLLLITGTWHNVIPLEDWLDVIHECAVRGIPTATLHLDTFWGKSRGNRKWWRELMFHTAYIFTADGDYQKQWKLFGKNHIWLPPAVRHDACHFGNYREEYACDVAFVGSNGVGYHEDVWNYRKEIVDTLRDMCTRNGWSFKNPGGDEPKVNRDNDMNDFYASAKVTVGDSLCLKKEKSHYFSDRAIEAPARGGLLIMPQINLLGEIYKDTLPMYKWGDWEDLENKIKYYLNDKVANDNVRLKTHAIAKQNTYVDRLKQILEVVFND